MELKEKYLSLKQELAAVEEELKQPLTLSKRQLIKDKSTGKHYRYDYTSLDSATGEVSLRTREIKYNEINWQSCSTPKFSSLEDIEVVDWSFDHGKKEELEYKIYETDSISEKEDLLGELKDMYVKCFHNWEYNIREDNYVCSECLLETVMEERPDRLNGTQEYHEIDWSFLEEL